MPDFRCEFDVKGDLVLPPDINELEFRSVAGFTITIRNGEADEEGHVGALVAIVVGPAESIDSAADELRYFLAEQLDVLTFATHSRFQIVAPRRLVEWQPNQIERRAKLYLTHDARYPPEPALGREYIDTVEILDQAELPAYARTALKYFRYGLLDNQPEDQFMRLWLALEIIAENKKEKDRVPITCHACGADLKCECGADLSRVPMAKQAIESIIHTVVGSADSAAIAKRQFTARNGLMHGRGSASIEAACKVTMTDIVDELGWIAFNAIGLAIPPLDKELTFGHRDGQFANMSMVANVTLGFSHDGDGTHPPEEKIPSGKLEVLTRFGDAASESEPGH